MTILAQLRKSHGETCLDRLLTVPTQPGRWGKFLSSILLFGWSINLLVGDRSLATWEALEHLTSVFGYVTIGLLFLVASAVPVIGIAVDRVWVSIAGTSLALLMWLWLLMEAILTNSLGRAAVWTCVVGVLAAMNAETQLALRVYGHEPNARR